MQSRFFKILAILFILSAAAPAFAEEPVPAEKAYARVMQSMTLRCGYGIFPPVLVKDPNTGAVTGIFADLMREIGKAAGLKVEFVEEVDWGQIPQALRAGRIDAMCAGMWGTAKRARDMAFTRPLFYSVAKAYARADDTRFDNNPAAIDSPQVKLSVNDGDVSQDIADRLFPRAQRFHKVQMAGEDFLLMNVVTGKADVVFTAPSIAKAFIKANPDSLREVPMPAPLAVNQNVIGLDVHEYALKNLLDTAVAELGNNGVIEKIFRQYGPAATGDLILALK